jgi:O-antigen/teichoic acid export membrane protein
MIGAGSSRGPGWLNNALRGPTVSAVGRLVVSTGLGQLAILVTLPIAMRLYGALAYGQFALISSFVGVASVGACLCLDIATIQGRDTEAADEICAAALFSVPLTALISALCMFCLIVLGLVGYNQLSLWSVPIAAIMVGLNGVYLASRYRVLRERRYADLARATLAQNGGRAVAPLVWAALFPDWTGLGLGEISGRLLGIHNLMRSILPQLQAHAAWCDARSWLRVVRRESRFTVILLGSVLVDSTASLLIAPLIAGSFGAAAAGEYFIVANMLVVPSALLGTAIADVIHTRSAQLYLESPQDLTLFLRRAALALLCAGLAIYLPIFALSPLVCPVLFGAKWPHIAPIAQALTPFMIVAFVASPCSRLLFVLKQTGWKAASDAIRLAGTTAVIAGATFWHLGFLSAMWALSWFLAASYGGYFALIYIAAARSSARAVVVRSNMRSLQ